MNRVERGQRNLAKLRKIASPRIGRGVVTFWNPTPDQKTTSTIYSNDASLVAQLHDVISPDNQARLIASIATLAGMNKILTLAWSNATFTSTDN
jgi:hypothetical protein